MSESRMRRFLDYLLLLLALAVAGYAVWNLRQPSGGVLAGTALWWILILAGVAGGIALRRMEVWLPDGRPAPRPVPIIGERRRWLGYLCFALTLSFTAGLVVKLWPDYRMWHGTPLLWLLSLVSILVGGWLVGAMGEPASREVGERFQPILNGKPVRYDALPRWIEVAAFLAIGALAVFLRTYRLGEIPAGIYVDETNGALDALYILEGRDDSPFGTGWYETPNGYIYYMALLFEVFGATRESLKAASIIPAVLTVLAVYPLGRVLFGPTAAIAAMLLTAVSRWHLTMSRWGWNEVAPPVFQVLATFYLLRGLRDRRAFDFAAGGVIAGWMVYTYLSSRLALATLAFFGLYWLLTDPAGPIRSWRKHWAGFTLFAVAAIVAVAPLAVTYITNPFTFLNRVSEISVLNQVEAENSYEPLLENVRRHLGFFHQAGDRSGKHNLPGEPQTDPVTGVLFVVGLGYGLVRLRDRRRGLLWLWMFFAMIGGVFSVLHESPQAYRTLTAVPAIALLAGDVLARLCRGLLWLAPQRAPSSAAPRWRTALAVGVMLASLTAAAAWETNVYFGRQAESVAVKGSFNPTETWVANEVIAALQRDDVVYLSPRFWDFSPLRFLVYGVMKEKTGRNTLQERPYQLARPEVDLPVPEGGRDALFLLDSYYLPAKDFLLEYYPTATIELPRDVENRIVCVRMELPRAALASAHGLRAEYTMEDGSVEKAIVAQIDQDWSARRATRASWSGGLRIEKSAVYELGGDGDLVILVDGEIWEGSRFLGRGLHSLDVTQRESRSGGARLAWGRPGGALETVPASALFQGRPPNQGLTAEYFDNMQWEGEPRFHQTTPFLLLFWPEGDPFYAPFSARFTGKLRIEKAGPYGLWIQADDGARLTIDGRVVAEDLTPLRANRLEANVQLEAGDHPIQIDYFQQGGSNALEFSWQPPGEHPHTVPPQALIPAILTAAETKREEDGA